jgi:ABC-type transporter Mla subunit MlaD
MENVHEKNIEIADKFISISKKIETSSQILDETKSKFSIQIDQLQQVEKENASIQSLLREQVKQLKEIEQINSFANSIILQSNKLIESTGAIIKQTIVNSKQIKDSLENMLGIDTNEN